VNHNREPKVGDLVVISNQPGVFKIVKIHSASKTVTVRPANGNGSRKSGFPWSLLSYFEGLRDVSRSVEDHADRAARNRAAR
jgi:hypothetical protein